MLKHEFQTFLAFNYWRKKPILAKRPRDGKEELSSSKKLNDELLIF
jgi:hypothetical protein